jgi:hypothetical protein
MGRSPILILTCLSAISLGADNLPGTDPGTEPYRPAQSPVVFDASAYLGRMGRIDVASVHSTHGPGLMGGSPGAVEAIQSVPLPPAFLGMASLGMGWVVMRGVKHARRRLRRR